MRSSNTYLPILSLFGVFLVVTTLQLGKSRTTLNSIQKQKNTTTQELPLSDMYQPNQIPHEGFGPGPVLMKPATSLQQSAFPNPPDTLFLDEGVALKYKHAMDSE